MARPPRSQWKQQGGDVTPEPHESVDTLTLRLGPRRHSSPPGNPPGLLLEVLHQVERFRRMLSFRTCLSGSV